TARFLARISARSIFQLFSACVSATFCCDSAWRRAISDWRYCQIEVAMRPAAPMTKLDRKPWYLRMKRPILVSGSVSAASAGLSSFFASWAMVTMRSRAAMHAQADRASLFGQQGRARHRVLAEALADAVDELAHALALLPLGLVERQLPWRRRR